MEASNREPAKERDLSKYLKGLRPRKERGHLKYRWLLQGEHKVSSGRRREKKKQSTGCKKWVTRRADK